VQVRTIEASIHGRYLVEGPAEAPLLLGFHGYGEDAEAQLDRMRGVPTSEPWQLCSVQALSRFYRSKGQHVVASWMTRQDRAQTIDDNVTYVKRVLDALAGEGRLSGSVVATGFSQGVAMAYRAAAKSLPRCSGIIAVGGDLPPELGSDPDRRWPPILIARGESDEWYTAENLESDEQALASQRAELEANTYACGHEWSAEISEAAGRFLDRVRRA